MSGERAEGILGWLRELFSVNLDTKAISLLVSIGLFVWLRAEEKPVQRAVDIDLVALQPSSSARRVLMTSLPPSIRVQVRGTQTLIDRLAQKRPPAIELDLRDGKVKEVAIDASMAQLPQGLEVLSVEPRRLKLEWDDLVTRSVAVQAAFSGKPADGFVIKGEPEVAPKSVNVEGPTSAVETMQFVRLAPFNLTAKVAGTYRQPLAMDPAPNLVTYLDPPRAQVTVTIARLEVEQRFEVPVQVVGHATAAANPKRVIVTVRGTPEVVNGLKKELVVPRADVKELGVEVKEQRHGSAVLRLDVDVAGAVCTVQPPSVTLTW